MTPKEKRALYVGGVAAVVVGGLAAVYVVSKKKATAPAPSAPTTTTLPAAVGGGVVMQDGAQTLNATSGTIFTVSLPSGGVWVSLTSAGLNGASLLGPIPAGSGQPISVTAVINDTITGVWQQNGQQHTGTIKVAATLPTAVTG